jgi:capsular exopolysaccharide synthesis family protein
MQKLLDRRTDLAVQQAQLAGARAAIEAQDRKNLLEVNPSVMETLERDPVLERLTSELKLVEAAEDRVRPTMGKNHPQWQEYESSRKSYQDRMDSRKAELTEKAIKALRIGYEQQYTTITNSLVEVDDKLTELYTNQREINRAMAEIEQLTEQKDRQEKALETLEGRRRDLELVQQNQLARISKNADLPIEEEYPPKLWIMVTGGIVLGALLGIGLALALEVMDTSVKMPTDITRKVDLPLLAMVPHADDIEEEIEDVRLACLTAPDSLISEAFRELRTNLLFSGPAEQRRATLITSPSPSDGRTTVAVNVAIALASSGRRVLLVDTNFRRPAVTTLFPEAGQAGLSDVLSGQRPWTECVHPASAVPNLTVMASGPLPPNPSELLGHELTAKMLEEMGQQYDQVILDGPPLLMVTDASVIATQCDSTILVVRAGVNSHGIVMRCRDNLGRVGAHVLGVVLNGVQATAGGYLQKNYDAFYDYHEQPEA